MAEIPESGCDLNCLDPFLNFMWMFGYPVRRVSNSHLNHEFEAGTLSESSSSTIRVANADDSNKHTLVRKAKEDKDGTVYQTQSADLQRGTNKNFRNRNLELTSNSSSSSKEKGSPKNEFRKNPTPHENSAVRSLCFAAPKRCRCLCAERGVLGSVGKVWSWLGPWCVGLSLACFALRPVLAFTELSTFSFFWATMLVFALLAAQLFVQYVLLCFSFRHHFRKLRVAWASHVTRFCEGKHARCRELRKRSGVLVRVLLVITVLYFSSMMFCTYTLPAWQPYLAPLDKLSDHWFLAALSLNSGVLVIGFNTLYSVLFLYVIVTRLIRDEFLLVTQELKKVLPHIDALVEDAPSRQHVIEDIEQPIKFEDAKEGVDSKESVVTERGCVSDAVIETVIVSDDKHGPGSAKSVAGKDDKKRTQVSRKRLNAATIKVDPGKSDKVPGHHNPRNVKESYPNHNAHSKDLGKQPVTVIDLEDDEEACETEVTTEAQSDIQNATSVQTATGSTHDCLPEDMFILSFENPAVYYEQIQNRKPLSDAPEENCRGKGIPAFNSASKLGCESTSLCQERCQNTSERIRTDEHTMVHQGRSEHKSERQGRNANTRGRHEHSFDRQGRNDNTRECQGRHSDNSCERQGRNANTRECQGRQNDNSCERQGRDEDTSKLQERNEATSQKPQAGKRRWDTWEVSFGRLRSQHESVCGLLRHSQQCFKHFIALNFAVSVPLVCFLIYSLGSGAVRVNQWGFLFTVCLQSIAILCALIVLAISLQEAARSPLPVIYASDWSVLPYPLVNKLQLLTCRLHDSDLAYHVYGLFSISRDTVLMLTGTFITYAVVVIQFQMGSPVTSYCPTNATL